MKCPYCDSQNTQKVIIRLSNGQEQKLILCNKCKKIFRENEN